MVRRSGSARYFILGIVSVIFVLVLRSQLLSGQDGDDVFTAPPLSALASSWRTAVDDHRTVPLGTRSLPLTEQNSRPAERSTVAATAAGIVSRWTDGWSIVEALLLGPKGEAKTAPESLPKKEKGYILRYSPESCRGSIVIEGYEERRSIFTFDEESYKPFVETNLGSNSFEAVLIGPTIQHLYFKFDPNLKRYVASFVLPTRTSVASLQSEHHHQQTDGGKYVVLVRHMYTDFQAVDEKKEESNFHYVDSPSTVPPRQLVIMSKSGEKIIPLVTSSLPREVGEWIALGEKDSNLFNAHLTCQDRESGAAGIRKMEVPMWVQTRSFTDHRRSALSGYWLTITKPKYNYEQFPNYNVDLLGRMNLPGYHRENVKVLASEEGEEDLAHWLKVVPPRRPPCGRECALDVLRDRTIYFFGDSHMRILFYGFLSRLGIAYPMNKVWRGDRTDRIVSHNVTIKFVASYFLNMSRPTAVEMLQDNSHPIVVAGVGQHHSCHCWALKKHMGIIEESIDVLRQADKEDKPRRDVIWLGVPAQPYNRHLHAPKPVGQARKDCRNNVRHLIYNSHQQALMNRLNIPFVDALALSVDLTHTSLDGAHYYTEARDAWLDHLLFHAGETKA